MLCDFGGSIDIKDDYERRPYEEAEAYAYNNDKDINPKLQQIQQKMVNGTFKRNTILYEEPIFVKYLTPVEKVKELADFIKRVNDTDELVKKSKFNKYSYESKLYIL